MQRHLRPFFVSWISKVDRTEVYSITQVWVVLLLGSAEFSLAADTTPVGDISPSVIQTESQKRIHQPG